MKKVQVEAGLYEKVEQFIRKRSELGYTDVDEFTRDALRQLILGKLHNS